MLKLHGRPRSNYYNAVKAVLIEKDIPFEEVIEPLPPTPEFLAISPMSKVPCLVTEHGPLTETTAIIEYLEDTHPHTPLAPSDPYQRAKLRELCKSLELYIEWVARRGYGVLRGETVSEHDQAAVRAGLEQSTAAITQLVEFDPWIAGAELTYADFFGYFMLIYAAMSAKANADMDLFAAIPGSKEWYAKVGERPSMQTVLADAKAYAKAMQG